MPTISRRMRAWQILVVSLAGLSAGASLANAQSLIIDRVSKPVAKQSVPLPAYLANHRDWTVKCAHKDGAQKKCNLTTPIDIDDKVPANFAKITITGVVNSKVKTPTFYFTTPLGLLMPKGAGIMVNKSNLGLLAFRSCHPNGCLIPFQLTKALENRLRRGNELSLILYTLDGKANTVRFSLMGFTKAINDARIQAQN